MDTVASSGIPSAGRFVPRVAAGRAWFLLMLGGLVGFPAGVISAQDAGSVLGRISDASSGAPLSGATITVSGTDLRVVSGERGWYFLAPVPTGPREIVVELLGYTPLRDSIRIEAGGAQEVDLRLSASPIPLEGLVVSSEAPHLVPAHRTVIGSDEIARRKANSLTQLLQGLVPGVVQTNTSGQPGSSSQIRIRGIRSLQESPVLFFVDGVRVGSAAMAAPQGTDEILAFLDNINISDVDRIEVVRNPEATLLYGTDARGGVLLIYTKRGGGIPPTPLRPGWLPKLRPSYVPRDTLGVHRPPHQEGET